MTQQTSNLVETMESWDKAANCFPSSTECPVPAERFNCHGCPFYKHNRAHFINQLKMINLLEIDNVDVSKIRKDD